MMEPKKWKKRKLVHSLGKKCGTKFSNKATILGGAILIAIGIEIFVSGVF